MLSLGSLVFLYLLMSSTAEWSNTTQDLIRELQLVSYDDVPPDTKRATIVEIDLYINRLSDVVVSSMEYRIDVFLTQRWTDNRLIFNQPNDRYVSLPDSLISRLWIPDLFIAQAKDGKVHSITSVSKVVKLNPRNGTMLCSQRIQAEIACTMDLKNFPFDSQMCEIRLGSWRYDMDFIKLRWLPGSFDGDYDNREVDKKLSKAIPSLSVDTFVRKDEVCNDTARPEFSCLTYHITFYRKLLYYVGDIYIPSLLMVIVTWMSFWIDRKVIQGRCALGALTMVAISNQINSVRLILPPTAQVKAADVWLWTCEFYVLAAFLQFGLVNFLSRRDEKKRKVAGNFVPSSINPLTESQAAASPNPGCSSANQSASTKKPREKSSQDHGGEDIELEVLSMSPRDVEGISKQETTLSREEQAADTGSDETKCSQLWTRWCAVDNAVKVDYISRALFPGTFTLFTIGYWCYFVGNSAPNPKA